MLPRHQRSKADVELDVRNTRLAYLLLSLCTGIFFFEALTPGKLFYYLDHSFQNIPFRFFAFESVKLGRMPLWCPFTAGGFPLFAEGQSGAAYIINWPFYSLLPFSSAYNISLILHFALMAIGVYKLFTHLGYPMVGSLAASISLTFSGCFIRKMMFVNYLQGISWIPWLLLVITPTVTGRTRSLLGRAVCGSIILGMIGLAGHPQVVLFALVSLWLFTLFGPIRLPGRTRLAMLLFISAAGLLMACWQLLPTIELMTQTIRSRLADPAFSGQMSMPPAYTPVFFLNDPFGNAAVGSFASELWPAYEWELNSFVGIGIFCLAWFPSVKHPNVRFFWSCIILGLFLSLGTYTLGGDYLYKLPMFSGFRAPARWSFITVFGLAGLVAHAITEFTSLENDRQRKQVKKKLIYVWLGLAMVLGAIIFNSTDLQLNKIMIKSLSGCLFFVILVTLIIITALKVRSNRVLFMFPLLIFCELFWAHHDYPSVSDEKMILDHPAVIDAIKERGSRILSLYHEQSPLVDENWHQGWSQKYGDYPALSSSLPMYSGLIYKIRLLTFDEWSPLHYYNYVLFSIHAPKLENLILRSFNCTVCLGSPKLSSVRWHSDLYRE